MSPAMRRWPPTCRSRVPGATLDRQCASGLSAIAQAAQRIVVDGAQVAVGGGVETISLVQNDRFNGFRARDRHVSEVCPDYYLTMIETAEVVARRYGVGRAAQDAYALQSQAAHRGGAGGGAVRRRDRAGDRDPVGHRPATAARPRRRRSRSRPTNATVPAPRSTGSPR